MNVKNLLLLLICVVFLFSFAQLLFGGDPLPRCDDTGVCDEWPLDCGTPCYMPPVGSVECWYYWGYYDYLECWFGS
jgi:hypothetical protein